MPRPCVVLDASVLYREPLRSLLLWIAAEGGFDPRWSERILTEVGANLLGAGVLTRGRWDRLLGAMQHAFPEAGVEQAAIDAIEARMPNQAKDRHVLAAAVVAGAGIVVTDNLRDFRAADLAPLGKRALDPDIFLCETWERAPALVLAALEHQVANMRRPRRWTLPELLGLLGGLGAGDPSAPRFVATLEEGRGLRPLPPPGRERD